ncbi:MAG: HlyC/CorC family transporter [Candidatus Hydrogenedentes bacterium]|nr:HlyC/CorC family transporter [Candidatus Hydrogenedentota bacterium]
MKGNFSGVVTRRRFTLGLCAIAIAFCVFAQAPDDATATANEFISTDIAANAAAIEADASLFEQHFPFSILLGVGALLCCSAFFSGSETAFFSINKLRLRTLKEDGTAGGALIAQIMEHPGRLLTTILIGNMIVNTLIGILLGARAESFLGDVMPSLHPIASYAIAVTIVTLILVFVGEISPKVFAVQASEQVARAVVFPVLATDKLLAPLRDGLLGITNLLFKITRFHEVRAAPFITDEEFKSALTEGEVQGVIEEDERQMIQGILEFSDAQLREILVPRQDAISLAEDSTVAQAHAIYREHQYSRMPVYRESMDKIIGILVAKDLLPFIARGETDRSIQGLIRPAHFVPATMTVQQFVRDAQRHRSHLAIVVDEYGGTAGIVTLEDAMEQVVGDIMDEGEQEEPGFTRMDEGVYALEGDFSLDDLNELLGTALHDDEHETVAGFLMHRSEKVLETGDAIECDGVRFTVADCDGKRVSSVLVKILRKEDSAEQPAAEKTATP